MAEGWQDAPAKQGNGDLSPPPSTTQTSHAQSPSATAAPLADPLQGFEPATPDALGRGQRLRKPSAYVRNLKQGIGVASTHPNDPILPRGVQPPNDNAGNATLALTDDNDPPFEFAMAAAVQAVRNDPANMAQVKQLEDWPKWSESIQRELDQHKRMGTWELVKPPDGANIVGSHFIFHYKHDAAGNIVSRKARLVAQGYTQAEGIDYKETFSPTAKLSAIRVVIAIAVRNDWELEQTDIDGAYLNASLSETIHMRQPKGYEVPGKEDHVCLLRRALYGLKQAGREWYHHFYEVMLKLGLTRCQAEHAVFYRYTNEGALIVAVDVDDLTMAGSSKQVILGFKDHLHENFQIKDLGDLRWLLGIEVKRDHARHTVSLSQRSYIDKIVERFALQDAKPVSTPLDPHHQLTITQSPSTPRQYEDMRNVPYREAIGSLMYAALGTRPDIAFAVAFLSQFMQNPGRPHWEAAKRIFRYLKGTRDHLLVMGGKNDRCGLEGYCDADWASQEHRHSTSGYVFTIDGGAVSWSSKKQAVVALSTTEAEYIAATHTAKEALWLRTFISEVTRPLTAPVVIYCDNQSTVSITKNDQFHARTKHIDIRHHFVRDVTEKGLLTITYCPTSDNAADIFTKPLAGPKLEHLMGLVGLRARLKGEC